MLTRPPLHWSADELHEALCAAYGIEPIRGSRSAVGLHVRRIFGLSSDHGGLTRYRRILAGERTSPATLQRLCDDAGVVPSVDENTGQVTFGGRT